MGRETRSSRLCRRRSRTDLTGWNLSARLRDKSLSRARPTGEEVPSYLPARLRFSCRFTSAAGSAGNTCVVLARWEGCGITCSWTSGSSADSNMPPPPWLSLASLQPGASAPHKSVPRALGPCISLAVHRCAPCWGCRLCAWTRRRPTSASPRGCRKRLVQQPPWRGRRTVLCRTGPAGTRGGVGHVPAELSPSLLGRCRQLRVNSGVAKLSRVGVVFFFSVKCESPQAVPGNAVPF